MDIRKLQRAIVDGLENIKAQDIVIFNTEHLSPLFERVIIASANTNRQTKALASSVRETVKEAGYPVPRSEGEENGEWIIVDCGDAVVHIMQPTIRSYYRLEEIWGEKPVRVKLVSDKKAAAAKTAPRKTAASGTKTGVTEVKSGAVKKASAKKAPVKKTSASKTAPAKTVKVAKTTAKKPAAKTSARTGTSRTAAQKTAVKKTVRKKAD